MSKIDDLKQEVEATTEALRMIMGRLQKAQRAEYHIKAGDLLKVNGGTYGKPKYHVYRVTRVVFTPNDVVLYGVKLLKDGQSFHSVEQQIFNWSLQPSKVEP